MSDAVGTSGQDRNGVTSCVILQLWPRSRAAAHAAVAVSQSEKKYAAAASGYQWLAPEVSL
jgi:hypothetical protein